MKIGYFADGPWSHLAIEKIVTGSNFEIAFIVPRFETRDPVLADWARRLGIDFLPIQNVNSAENIEKLRAYGADIFVSMSFNQILKLPIIAAAPLGFINCHAGALPYFRGRNILNWVLINDAPEFGVTVYYVDEGIDTGDIILQRKVSISDEDSYATLLSRAISLCGDVLLNALELIDEGRVQRTPQRDIHPEGFYCGGRMEGDEWIDWNWPSRRIFNFIRAISEPGPGARAHYNGHDIIVAKAAMIPDAPNYIGHPGEIVGLRGGGIVVKTGDSTILLAKVLGGPERFRIGMRFDRNTNDVVRKLEARISALESKLLEH